MAGELVTPEDSETTPAADPRRREDYLIARPQYTTSWKLKEADVSW